MNFVMSDLHGCYEQYRQMLEKIRFSEENTLFILGDVLDRGDEGIRILLDMMKRPNVVPLLGNHEYMAYSVLKKFNVEVTADNYDTYLDSEAMEMYDNWIFNGGLTTCREFLKLNHAARESVLAYLGEFELYEEIEANGNTFVLVHGGLVGFEEHKDLSEYGLHDIVWGRCDYARQYYPDKYLVTGHTPTSAIDSAYKGRIYRENRHVAIDCGAVFGNRLGCFCLDTQEEFYVD